MRTTHLLYAAYRFGAPASLAGALIALTIYSASAQTADPSAGLSSPTSEPATAVIGGVPITVIDQGQDFTLYRAVTALTNSSGAVRLHTNQFTILENNLHYLQNGQWQTSQDVIESFPGGAVARHGPNQAIFSNDLNTDAVFDIQASDGNRIAGGVRSIQLTDIASGKSLVLGTVRQSVPAQLLPPNQILYADAFDGIKADVLLTWKHNLFSHDILLKAQPQVVEGLDPATTRLEILTEFIAAPAPLLNQQTIKRPGQANLIDDTLIRFGALAIVVGHSFPADGQEVVRLGDLNQMDGALPVLKQWSTTPDGRTFLIESVAWMNIQGQMKDLPVTQARVEPNGSRSRLLSSRSWQERPVAPAKSGPVQIASLSYKPKGYALDFVLLPDSPLTNNFTAQQTYWITNNYYCGGASVSFAPGCVIKYNPGNWMMLYGQPITFPITLQSVVFTSKDDNAFGEVLPGSTGTPTQGASQAIWIYYVSFNTTISSARFRYCQRGIQYDQNSGVTASHTVQDCLFEQITNTGSYGIYVNIPSGPGVTLSGVQKYNVTTPVYVQSGSYYGTPSDVLFHTVKAFTGIDGTQDGQNPPDRMGAVGAGQFFEMLNGMVEVFDRASGSPTASSSLKSFFQMPSTLDTLTDPRVLFDNGANQRWAVSIADVTAKKVLLQVSLSSSATPLDATNWRKYSVPISYGTGSIDQPALGMDANGLYISVQVRTDSPLANQGYQIIAFKKPDVYTVPGYQWPNPLTVAAGDIATWSIQPAYNFDAPVNSYAWLVAKGPASGNAGGRIAYRRVQWSGANIVWYGGDPSWQTVATRTDYYDIPQNATFSAPQTGGSVDLGQTGSRLLMSVIRNGYLWTFHHVGLNSQGTYTGGTGDRSAAQWFQLQVGASGLILSNQGRIYDSAASSPYWYYFPSLNINSSGDFVVGFSGAKTGENVGAFFQARKANGTWMSAPAMVQSGREAYTQSRWGDYSSTAMDPDGTFWTVQEHASFDVNFSKNPVWGTWIMQISP